MRTREETMYKIVNNNISITRGETATYNVKVIDKVTGAPFILPHRTEPNGTSNQIDKFIGLFSVRRSDYIADGYAIKKFLWFCPVDNDVTDKPEQLFNSISVCYIIATSNTK